MGTFVLLFVFVLVPLVGSAYAYFKIYRRLKSLGRSRVGAHSATLAEATIAMKMLVMMLLFTACWAPATVMMCWRILARPNSDHPLIDLWSAVGCTAAGFLTPTLNCILFINYRNAVKQKIPISAPLIDAISTAATHTHATMETTAMTTMMALDEELDEDEEYTGEYR